MSPQTLCMSDVAHNIAWIQTFRASGLDGISVRQFIGTDQGRSIYNSVPMPVDATLATCLGQEQFLCENLFGVVAYGSAFGI